MGRPRRVRRTPRGGATALLLAVIAALAMAAGWTWHDGWWRVPDRHNPWAPFALDETPGWLTDFKLRRARGDPAACRAALDAAGWRIEPVPDRDDAGGCGWRDALRVRETLAEIGAPLVLACPAALSLAWWERHVVAPAAQAHLGAPIARIEHFGSYACRARVGTGAGSALSRHAAAQAIDVAGFVADGGRRVSVVRDWGTPTPSGRFLAAVHQGACRGFDVVLGPEHNAAHADHLHLDLGGGRACR